MNRKEAIEHLEKKILDIKTKLSNINSEPIPKETLIELEKLRYTVEWLKLINN